MNERYAGPAAGPAAGPGVPVPPASLCMYLSAMIMAMSFRNGSRLRHKLPPHTPFTVLHIDAHNDLNVPARHFSLAAREGDDAILAAVDLANFQLSAVWAGAVSRIIWIRQSELTQVAPCSHAAG